MKEPIGILGGKTVYAVDGDEIKVKHTMDFVEGGNGMVYDFVPRDELWVDARIKSQDWPHIAFHEAVESLLMEEYGLGYDEAHARANALEVGEIKRVASDGILRVAHDLLASDAEKEVERFLKKFLPGTPFAGRVHAVGGYNRDQLLGLDPKDLDLVVELPSERGKSMPEGAKKFTHFVYQQFPQAVHRPFQTGAAYPIWQLVFEDDIELGGETYHTKGAAIDVADTMKEIFPDPESRQRQVEWGTLQDDVERRDFTVNSLLKDMTTGEFIDLTGVSIADIKKGILRGNPMVSMDEIFRNDPLRMIRLLRFQAKYGWQVPMSVLRAVKRNAERIRIVSAERIMGELEKVMKMGKLAQAVKMMKATGLLPYVMPEVDALRGVGQDPRFHEEGSVLKHTLNVLRNAPPTVEGQLAALMHDLGKATTREVLADGIHFYGHEEAGAEMAEAMLRRLKFDNETTKKVVTVVRNHMRPHRLADASEKALRKFMRDLGEEMVDAILALAKADEEGSYGPMATRGEVERLKERLQKVKESPVKVQRKPVLSGIEIMQELGIKPDDRKRLPEIGKAQKLLLEIADEYASEGKELTQTQAVIELRLHFHPAE
jgi:putative nucleotidyltransferase with HDIG domain